jgi:hypothetical protein
MLFQRRGYDMLRVPELPHLIVRDSCECAATRRPPIRCKDRLPHDQHSQLSVALPRQQLLSCGRPPADKSVKLEREARPGARKTGNYLPADHH